MQVARSIFIIFEVIVVVSQHLNVLHSFERPSKHSLALINYFILYLSFLQYSGYVTF